MTTTAAKDPVCGMEVKASSAAPHSRIQRADLQFLLLRLQGLEGQKRRQFITKVYALALIVSR